MPDTDWIDRVARHGVALGVGQVEQLARYGGLLRELGEEVPAHAFVEALSLVQLVQAHVAPGEDLLDSGTELGLPAIPLFVALPDRRFVMTERSAEKAAFLWKIMGALGLVHVSLIHGDTEEGVPWPQGASHDSLDGEIPEDSPVLISVRATEPLDTIMDIVDILPEGGMFLCHSGEIS